MYCFWCINADESYRFVCPVDIEGDSIAINNFYDGVSCKRG